MSAIDRRIKGNIERKTSSYQCERRIHEIVFRHKIFKFISYHLIQHFQIIKRHVSLIKYLNNVTEGTRTNTTQYNTTIFRMDAPSAVAELFI